MYYNIHNPVDKLKPYVKFIWVLEAEKVMGGGGSERILPDGCIELIFHYGDIFNRVSADGSLGAQPRSFVIGQVKKYLDIKASGNTGIIGVRFYPYGFSAFTNMPLHYLTDQTISPGDIFGCNIAELEFKIFCAKNEQERINLVQFFLINNLANTGTINYVIAESIRKIMKCDGLLDIYKLRKNIKISEKHFERKFNDTVGINPKLFSRILRFQNAIKTVENNDFNSLVSRANQGGYYDQAHFTRDFKEFAGQTPGECFKTDHQLSDFFTQEK